MKRKSSQEETPLQFFLSLFVGGTITLPRVVMIVLINLTALAFIASTATMVIPAMEETPPRLFATISPVIMALLWVVVFWSPVRGHFKRRRRAAEKESERMGKARAWLWLNTTGIQIWWKRWEHSFAKRAVLRCWHGMQPLRIRVNRAWFRARRPQLKSPVDVSTS